MKSPEKSSRANRVMAIIILGLLSPVIVFGNFWVSLEVMEWSTTAISTMIVCVLVIVRLLFGILRDEISDYRATRKVDILFQTGGFLLLVSSAYMILRTSLEFEVVQDFQPSLMFLTCILLTFLFSQNAISMPSPLSFLRIVGFLGAVLVLLNHFGFFLDVISRHASMFLLIPLAVHLSTPMRTWGRMFGATFLVLAITVTGSRTSAGVAVALLVMFFLVDRHNHFLPKLATVGAGFLGFGIGILFSPEAANRFFLREIGDQAVVIQGWPGELTNPLVINTSGRLEVWISLCESVMEQGLLFGKGGGYSSRFVSENFGWTHPHNEYLRILSDFGLFTLFCILVGALLIALGVVTNQQIAHDRKVLFILSIVVISSTGLTDLSWVSFGIAIPSAIALGIAIREENPSVRKRQL